MIVITQDTMGDLKFPAAYGSLLFVEALGVMLGPPVAGILKDFSGNYDSSLYISGSLLIISGTKTRSFEVTYFIFKHHFFCFFHMQNDNMLINTDTAKPKPESHGRGHGLLFPSTL